MIQIEGLHTASEETCSQEGESNEKPTETDVERELATNQIDGRQSPEKEMSIVDKDERHRDQQSDDEDDDHSQKGMSHSGPFNPALFSPGQLQAFQNAVAQFSVSAAATNMDKETLMNNVAVLQTAFFTLQQQQILQFQLIQHLQSQLLKKNGEKTEDDEQDELLKDEDSQLRPPSPMKRIEEMAVELDLSRRKSPSKEREREKVPESNHESKPPSSSSAELKYQNNFSLASNIITEYDTPSSENSLNSLAMLEKKTQEVLNSASQGILANNLLDEIAFANDKDAANGRNDPFKHRCKFCGKIFGSDSSLQIHIRSHTGERPFKCNVCGSRFTTKGNLKVHFQRHTEKYPHIPMNPNPVPEHLDKYFPPLIPQEALKEVPQTPPSHIPSPFPPRVMFPDFFPRPPPFDLFSSPMELRKPVDLSREKKSTPPPPPLSPEVLINEEPKIKEEPVDETLDLSDKKVASPPPKPEAMEEDPPKKEERSDYSLRSNSNHSHNHHMEMSKIPSVSPPSSSSSTSGSLYQDTVMDPAFYSPHMTRPDSNDSSWENYIEVSSDTSKLQELVDNIDSPTTEPNQCLVCRKVLSCRSALQMHYRVHTGERPFRCKICGRSFTTKGNLKTHMSVHRIKPPMRTLHQCPVCHQKFSNVFVLQQHIRLHTGEVTDLTPEQIRAAEIHEQPQLRMHPFGRPTHDSDDDDTPHSPHHKPEMVGITKENLRPRPRSPAPEDLRAMHTAHRLSVRSNEELSRDSSPLSQGSDVKRIRSSSPLPSPPMNSSSTRSPMTTPPAEVAAAAAAAAAAGRAHFPYGPPFLGMPHVLPPFMNQSPFMRNVPLVPSAAAAGMPPFGLFGVRGNTTTCNICFKTFACNSALEIHYRSHTKERPFKCTICDRGFSTKGNMKQHMLTHKIRDMFGNSNSGDESRMSNTSQEQSTRSSSKEDGNSINFAIKLEKSPSPYLDRTTAGSDGGGGGAKGNDRVGVAGSGGVDGTNSRSDSPAFASDYSMTKDAEIKKWCNKLSEMPENIAAS